jgi:hypothetical protein
MRFFQRAPRPQAARSVIAIESMETRRFLSSSHLSGGLDDGPNHDRNDDHGTDVVVEKGKHGADDGPGHDAGDARRGRGRDDGAGHR